MNDDDYMIITLNGLSNQNQDKSFIVIYISIVFLALVFASSLIFSSDLIPY
jgi:hypothetical protein